ncbi:acyclic terpene utilization AtuA family protein [Pukyongiella litopenaei]|uniref:DUF1446 domain-containing protein n=1 Tax=Pukyongiella litopenaei TaxID=2605946 RepID=A0A2S0MM38_9RHOB|nr:acyclic terpene utilization AtuA family protein [Pukyongiella litopenaei]AVO36887.1 DUF1446 domain-containing protein [Pukyongiella litopenaei]
MKTVRIGGASGFWGDAALATPQLLAAGGLDFIVYDYLAEITMAILARARAGDAAAGYAGDFVTAAMAPNLGEIARQGVRIVSNAGGVNPEGCAAALRAEIGKRGLPLKVAVVTGDDLMGRLDELARAAPAEMFLGTPFPPVDKVGSVNAYLGAFPIAAALDRGADIVITGRCVDSAVTLGACIHAFGWTPDGFDALAGGSLAGHILECGPQATGGNFTDWEQVADGLATIGYPIAEIGPDGAFEVTKPGGTGGLVSRGTVAEQMLYETGDPQAYVLPDVICDFSGVQIAETGPVRVRVSGARGRGAPATLKCCVTWENGYRGGQLFSFYGIDAEAKAGAFAEAALVRARSVLRGMNQPDFTETSVEIIGAESQFGAQRHSGPAREVAAKIAVRHPDPRGVGVFLKEVTGLGLAAAPGLSGFAGTRPRPTPVMALYSFLLPREEVPATVSDETGSVVVAPLPGTEGVPAVPPPPPPAPAVTDDAVEVPLLRLAFARSGDKGDNANIGVIARRPEFLPFIWQALDDAALQAVFGHFGPARSEKFLLPGSHSINILLHNVLGGGGTSSLRNDPQAKGYAQLLLCAPVRIDRRVLGDTR